MAYRSSTSTENTVVFELYIEIVTREARLTIYHAITLTFTGQRQQRHYLLRRSDPDIYSEMKEQAHFELEGADESSFFSSFFFPLGSSFLPMSAPLNLISRARSSLPRTIWLGMALPLS